MTNQPTDRDGRSEIPPIASANNPNPNTPHVDSGGDHQPAAGASHLPPIEDAIEDVVAQIMKYHGGA